MVPLIDRCCNSRTAAALRSLADDLADQSFGVAAPFRNPAAPHPNKHRAPTVLRGDAVGALVAAFVNGATADELASKFEVHRGTVVRHLVAAGVWVPNRTRTATAAG